MLLDEQIVLLENTFVAEKVPHAFGGAHALGYYGSIRATHDIDVNVFLPVSEVDRVFDVLARIGVSVTNPGLRRLAERDEQVRVRWESTPIDLFFAYDPLHQSSMTRRRRVDFYGDAIHVLSAEDLIVYKATFDREKDWRDIATVVFACPEPLDLDYVRDWVARIDGPERARVERLEELIASGGRSTGG